MISKKQGLIIAAAVIGGTGLGLMVLGDKDDDNGGEIPEQKKELMIRYEAPVYAPSEIYAPYTETNITEIIHNVVTNVLPAPPPTPTPNNIVIDPDTGRVTSGYFASEEYQKGYRERATARHTEARKKRVVEREAEKSYEETVAIAYGSSRLSGGRGASTPKTKKQPSSGGYRAIAGGGQKAI